MGTTKKAYPNKDNLRQALLEISKADPMGSSSVDLGWSRYSNEQVEILLRAVPSIFQYDWQPKRSSSEEGYWETTARQKRTISAVAGAGHSMNLFHVPRIIKTAKACVEYNLKGEELRTK